MEQKQTTIREAVSVSGTGLHTGNLVTLTFNPAPANHGYVYKRVDLEGQPEIKVDVDNVVDTSRGTSLEQNGARVATIEHPLAALAGLGIDNCLIEMDGVETPILDGSSKPFMDAILKAGIEELDVARDFIVIRSPVIFSDASKKVEIIALPAEDFRVSVMIDFETTVLGSQNAVLENISDFPEQISMCRTFVFLHELEYLMSQNLIRGGDLSNAIVFVDRIVSQEELDKLATLLKRPKVAVLNTGILNNVDLHHQNEPARHKLLDVIGDLTLLGRPVKAHIIARRPGHLANVKFAKAIREHLNNEKKYAEIPAYNPNAKPVFDISEIKRMLPHRYPFLLIDKVLEVGDNYIVGLKNVTANEDFFNGHFPAEPIMPGVLQVEAMAQVGGVFVLNSMPDPYNYDTYFLKINDVKFRHKVVPGDTLLLRLELLSPIRRGICHMKGIGYVGNRVVVEAELLAQVFRRKNEGDRNISVYGTHA